ncbi:DNA polymerase III subunit gamma/tau [Armatimonas sp.]|uniref:DNA polymerase III subunit gamma/tau n=1 Tax=Armatimonas sp. TaxID=1872638 RepID=UPI00286CCEFE|nr:DNA polymerase III subunit gamma/tau [Armatimonas sp.]
MAYQSLYRKYRPQTFADVVGQEHVVRTLQNAITSERIAHGYLFTGTRGTAKTTIARLLAKALNCLSGGDKGPVAEPCNACDACKEITAGSCIDVIELDAASHRGVADIEEVRKQVGYGPMEFRYKVFIIDEAHQLSSDAKDAFLKTLEEPPPGVVFILATTEPQSIPITIRSRCQQFDFKRGSLLDISKRLKYVLDTEQIPYSPEAINLVARGAEGSYRDSLSLLEQVLAFSPKQITAASVESVLGTLDTEQLARVTDCVARRDAPGVLALAGEILDSGKEARTLLKTLAGHFRDLLLVAVGGPAAASELAPEDVARLQGQVKYFAPQQILKAIDLLNEAQGETRWNNQHRLLTELTFLKLMTIGEAPDQPFMTAPIVFAQPVTLPEPSLSAAPSPKVKEEPEPEMADEEPDPVLEAALERSEDEEVPSLSASYFADDEVAPDDEDDFEPEPDLPTVVETEPEPEPVPAEKPQAPPVAPAAESFSLFDDDPAPLPAPPKPAPVKEPENDGLSLFDLSGKKLVPEVSEIPEVVVPKPQAKVEHLVEDEDDYPPPLDDFPPPLELDDDYAPVIVAVPPKPAPVYTPAPVPDPDPEPEPEPAPDPELELSDPRITLPAVQRAWPTFLVQAEKFSKKTSVMMSGAVPVEVVGRTVVLAFSQRMNYDMMNAPKQLEFVRKLLAKVIDPALGSVAIRFELAENAPPPPQRAIARQTVRRDPLAEIEALGREEVQEIADSAPAWTPPAPVSTPRPERVTEKREGWNTARFSPQGEPAPPPDLPQGLAGQDAELVAAAAPGSHKAQALSELLVQEILSTFGGEIIEG